MADSSTISVNLSSATIVELDNVTLSQATEPVSLPVSVLLGAADETILPIIDPIVDSTSIFGLGTGAVATGDKLLISTISGDSSGLTLNANGTWSFATMPAENIVLGLRVWDSVNQTMGQAGQITFDTEGSNAIISGISITLPKVLPTVDSVSTDDIILAGEQNALIVVNDAGLNPSATFGGVPITLTAQP